MIMHRLYLSAAFTALAVAHAAAQLGHANTGKLSGGQVTVMSDGPTLWPGTSGWRLVLERTVQPAPGTPGEFAQPEQVALLDDGAFVVVDSKPASIRVYDATGKFARAVGREGSDRVNIVNLRSRCRREPSWFRM